MHTFYHVTFKKPYNFFPEFNVNEEITIGNNFNPFYNYFYSTDDHISVGIPGGTQIIHYSTNLEYLARGTGITNYPNPQQIFPYLNNKFSDLYNLNRELILENIRIQSYPHMPSRLKCLWVTKTREEAQTWINNFSNTKELKLISFESMVEPIKVDSMLIPLPHDSLKDKEVKSHSYWSGEISEKPMIEYLFQGKAKITCIDDLVGS